MEEFNICSNLLLNSIDLNRKLHNRDLYHLKDYIIPELSESDYKGCSGKICVIGGNEVYCGAPFLSAMTSLKLGADLCFVITSKENSIPLKSYSCELIVYPYLYNNKSEITEVKESDLEKCVEYLMNRIDSCVIGPGLGLIDETTRKCLIYIIEKFIEKNVFLILDADIIEFIISNNNLFELIKNYENCIFTPNKNEFKKMILLLTDDKSIKFEQIDSHQIIYSAHKMNLIFKGPKILIKGFYDIFISQNFFFVSFISNPCLKRLGGLGDILTGLLAVFYCWASKKKKKISQHIKEILNIDNTDHHNECLDALSAFNGSYFLKILCKEGFNKNHRGLIASDIMNSIPHYFYNIYDKEK
ncbi:carbohydrate kinase, putative [Plasmodium gallinaceum]|uniref:ATP-dependent (S)-NAD(P)H-hydrate dehydratase n=1 Tax=Plasmodium gallinaceum TaxID=5849 RepID=A0A1J1GVB2_PLAGA|nr:carbohydrate kinase, putative [Plasmodium gallinaceum]CRG96489.1 carbohydrate kinase, putative [Plasmodium gallinaceum]